MKETKTEDLLIKRQKPQIPIFPPHILLNYSTEITCFAYIASLVITAF